MSALRLRSGRQPHAIGALNGASMGHGETMANRRVGYFRLWIALSIAWIVGWTVFFIQLAVFEPPSLLDYLTLTLITVGPPGGLGLIGWVISGFQAKF